MQKKSIIQIVSATLVAVVFLIFAACEKEPTGNTQGQKTGGVEPNGLTSTCSEPLKSNTVLGLLHDPDDASNHRINMILYHYGQALRSVVLDPNLLCYLEEALIADQQGNGVSLLGLAERNPSFASALNLALRQSMMAHNIYPRGVEHGVETQIADPNWNANAYLKSKMEYRPYNYDPVAYFVRQIPACDRANAPTILIAQEINECDEVPGWKGQEEILMSEDDVMRSSEAVVMVGPGLGVLSGGVASSVGPVTDGSNGIQYETSWEQGVTDRSAVDVDVDLHQIKAGYRYETNSRSEISCVVAMYSLTNASLNTTLVGWWDDFTKNDRKIHKDDINVSKVFNDDKNAFTIPGSIFDPGVSVVFVAGYEHDWYATAKDIPLGNCNPPSWMPPFKGKRKYQQEYYFTDCGFGSSWFFQTGSSRNIENEKCRFLLKRTN